MRDDAVDKVFLRGLRIETVIGVWEWERHVTQSVVIDIDMATDVRRAAESDSIDAALNYQEVATRVSEHVRDARYQLVESLAEAVARLVVTGFDVPWVRVSVAKPGAVEGVREVGVVIERTAESYA